MTIAPTPLPPSVPAQPLDQNGYTGLLCSEDRYRALTQDDRAGDPQLTSALVDAEYDVGLKCNRTLKFGHYKERLYVYSKGYVYPSAIPITEILAPFGSYQQGAGIWVGTFLPLPTMPIFAGTIPPQTDVEYWGGFNDQTIPRRLQRLIAKVAWYYLHPVSMPGLPAGAKQSSVGGITVSGDLSTLMTRDPELKKDVAAFTRPEAHKFAGYSPP